ncbi:MAG TPA: DUF4142 domain-containing protein, partial [Gemmatimonadales bacterium]|nr:DUF4142 domain-containing protein [Gemmatimonadales bacterium]
MMKKQGTAVVALAALGACLSLGPTFGFQQDSARPSPKPVTSRPATGSGATQPDRVRLSAEDQRFVMEAARGGIAEVKLGQLAAERASSDAVKQFAQRMVQDHGKANDELMQLAQQKGVILPKAIGAKHQQEMTQLSKLSGAAFDRAYMSHMVKDHQKDISAFQRESTRGKDPEVRVWAGKML